MLCEDKTFVCGGLERERGRKDLEHPFKKVLARKANRASEIFCKRSLLTSRRKKGVSRGAAKARNR